MELSNKKILVTGAGGFIGSHLCEYLHNKCVHLRALLHYNSRLEPGLLKALPQNVTRRIEVIFGDLKDSNTIRNCIKDIDIIFHLGALVSIPYSYLHPRDVIETNTLGTLNILEAAKERDIEKTIIISTSEVYGSALYTPIDEKHPLQAQSPYSASKIAAEKIAESFFRSYGLGISIVRLFNCFGPRQSGRAIIPTVISQALISNKIKVGSLSPRRDFTYVKDSVRGVVEVSKSDSARGEIINIGSGFSISVSQIIDKVSHILGKELTVISEEKRKRPKNSEVKELLADYSKAKGLIGWRPKITFDSGLRKTISWMRKYPNFYSPKKYNF